MNRPILSSLVASVASTVVFGTSSALAAVSIQRYQYNVGLGPQDVGKVCGVCYNYDQGEKVVGGGWYADTDSVLILGSTPEVAHDPEHVLALDAWCLTVRNVTQADQSFVVFLNCVSGLPPDSTVEDVWSDYFTVPADPTHCTTQTVDCPSGSWVSGVAFWDGWGVSSPSQMPVWLEPYPRPVGAAVSYFNPTDADWEGLRIGAVCLSIPGATMGASISSDSTVDWPDGSSVQLGATCPEGSVVTSGGWDRIQSQAILSGQR